MIRVSVLYPQSADVKFDWDYYLGKHVPLVREKLGSACKSVSIDKGLNGGAASAPPSFVAMFHMTFDSVAAFEAAFAPHAKTLTDDIANYTTAKPAFQISEVAA
jgi:uncharacterized protein (TIGR02118 family)